MLIRTERSNVINSNYLEDFSLAIFCVVCYVRTSYCVQKKSNPL